MEILAINRINEEPYNFNIARPANILPWLQDTTNQMVWARWGIAYRDVLILDGLNRPVARDNLTSHDLGVPANYAALKSALLAAARAVDSDQDGLLDDWELSWFGSLDARPDGDDDGDGDDNVTEFLYSSSPRDLTSRPSVQWSLAKDGAPAAFGVVFRCFSGSLADFVVETSSDLVTWTSSRTEIAPAGEPTNLHDGLGGLEVRYRQTPTAGAKPAGFIRVRATLKR